MTAEHDKPSILDRLLKLRALVERGTPGEQAAARRLLDKLLAKSGLSESDLDARVREDEPLMVRYRTRLEWKLAAQLAAYIDPDVTVVDSRRCWRFRFRKRDRIQFEVAWSILRPALARELDTFLTAFILRQGLMIIDEDSPNPQNADEEKYERIMQIARGIEHVAIHKQIGGR